MALCGGIVLEEALNLSSDRILNDDKFCNPPLKKNQFCETILTILTSCLLENLP